MNTPSYLILGHVARDIVGPDPQYGGTACYATLAASRLGERVGLVTSAGEEFPVAEALPGIRVAVVRSPTTTVFANVYSAVERKQLIQAVASKIHPHNVPKAWREAPVVHLAPIAQELDYRLARLFPGSLVGVTAQGWLREWDSEGRVRRATWKDANRVLPYVDVLVVSEDDIGSDLSIAQEFANQVRVVVVTRGERGA
ncbi:MAG: ribokinase, partial [Chloroflexi bacterium]|nr:ribokinase [Chloroflexota bacterium]